MAALGFLKGQMMLATRGKATQIILERVVRKHLDRQAWRAPQTGWAEVRSRCDELTSH